MAQMEKKRVYAHQDGENDDIIKYIMQIKKKSTPLKIHNCKQTYFSNSYAVDIVFCRAFSLVKNQPVFVIFIIFSLSLKSIVQFFTSRFFF